MLLSAAVEEYGFTKDFTPSARRWYTQKLESFIAWCAGEGVTHVEDVTAALAHRYLASLRGRTSQQFKRPLSGHTLRGYAKAVKAFLAWCAKDDLLPEKVARRIELPKAEQKGMAVFTAKHLAALFTACEQDDNPQLAARDKAIVAILIDTGIRANELCGLTLDAVTLGTDDAFIRVNGKGRKQREVGLGVKSRALLHRYIHRYRTAPPNEQHVFVTRAGKALRPEGLDRRLYQLRDRAGIEGVRVSAHTFRHSFACAYLEQGGDVYKLSRLLGHTSVVITEGYLRAFNSRAARQGPSVLDEL